MTLEQMQQAIEKLTQENAALKAAGPKTAGGLKVSQKGAVSLYGFGRFPITFYAETWEKIFAMQDTIKSFIAEGKSKNLLKLKADKAQD